MLSSGLLPNSRQGVVYRLVVRLEDCDIVRDTLRFERYKQALSHVGTAVRAHAHDGQLGAILLQRGTPRNSTAAPAGGNGAGLEWTDIEQWKADVIERILLQERIRCPAPRTRLPAAPHPVTPLAPNPSPPRPQPPNIRPSTSNPAASPSTAQGPASDGLAFDPRNVPRGWLKNSGWYLTVIAVIVITAWVAIIMMMTGGRPGALLDAFRGGVTNTTHEIQFDGPLAPEPIPTRR